MQHSPSKRPAPSHWISTLSSWLPSVSWPDVHLAFNVLLVSQTGHAPWVPDLMLTLELQFLSRPEVVLGASSWLQPSTALAPLTIHHVHYWQKTSLQLHAQDTVPGPKPHPSIPLKDRSEQKYPWFRKHTMSYKGLLCLQYRLKWFRKKLCEKQRKNGKRGKMSAFGAPRWRVCGNALYCFCNLSVCLELFQN